MTRGFLRPNPLSLGAALLAVCAASVCLAHKIGIFAAYDGDAIAGEIYFSGGGRPKGCRVKVRDASGRTLGEVTTNANGEFRFEPTTRADHVFSVQTGDGHSAEFRLRAEELSSVAARKAPSPAPDASTAEAAAPNRPEIEQAIARIVAKELAPLRRRIDEHERRTRLRDILGGIGYIFGVAGVLMMVKARGKRGQEPFPPEAP